MVRGGLLSALALRVDNVSIFDEFSISFAVVCFPLWRCEIIALRRPVIITEVRGGLLSALALRAGQLGYRRQDFPIRGGLLSALALRERRQSPAQTNQRRSRWFAFRFGAATRVEYPVFDGLPFFAVVCFPLWRCDQEHCEWNSPACCLRGGLLSALALRRQGQPKGQGADAPSRWFAFRFGAATSGVVKSLNQLTSFAVVCFPLWRCDVCLR